jgi:HEAT repeat protein
LGTDPAVDVRCQITALVAIYSKYLKQNPAAQAFLQAEFDLLSKDTSAVVRRSAAEAIVALCDATEHSAVDYTIKPRAMDLLEDASPEVRSVMTRNLGPLIASFGPDCCKELVTKYVASLNSRDITLVFAAAYSFPAVALTLTKARWPDLERGFKNAADSPEYRVRRTLAFGLVCYNHG